jgi:hypothetical protein
MAHWFDRALVASGRSSISIAHDLAEKGSHGNMLRAAARRLTVHGGCSIIRRSMRPARVVEAARLSAGWKLAWTCVSTM